MYMQKAEIQVYLQYRRPFAFERCFDDERIMVTVNTSDSTQTVNIASGNVLDLLTGDRINSASVTGNIDTHIYLSQYKVNYA